MARTKKRRPRGAEPASPSTSRRAWGALVLALGLGVLAAAAVVLVGSRDRQSAGADRGPIHVHGLGVNPADGSLFIATHTGLYRTAEGESRATRVGTSSQDTMGFTVVGRDRFLGSGHPDLRNDLPPLLGLIESTNAGESWESISLLGEADFHVLRSSGTQVYGYDASNDRLLASTDQGRSWKQVERPGPMLDLAVHPTERDRIVGAAEGPSGPALFSSLDGGRSWRSVGEMFGLLAWPAPNRLYAVTASGEVLASADDGASFVPRGTIGGEPAAFAAEGGSDLYVALHDGTIKRSTDGGSSWNVRSSPR